MNWLNLFHICSLICVVFGGMEVHILNSFVRKTSCCFIDALFCWSKRYFSIFCAVSLARRASSEGILNPGSLSDSEIMPEIIVSMAIIII